MKSAERLTFIYNKKINSFNLVNLKKIFNQKITIVFKGNIQ
jgi:hypothetical protein